MAAPLKWYGQGLVKALTGQIVFGTDTLKAMLCTVAYVPDQDAHVFRSSVTNEVAASGDYVAGGVVLDGIAVSYDAATNQARININDEVLANTTITARVVVIYKSRGGAAAADELVAFGINDADVVSSAGNYTLDFPVPALYVAAGA